MPSPVRPDPFRGQSGPPVLGHWSFLNSTQLQFQFAGAPNQSYTVLSTTNLALPMSDRVPLNPPVQTSPGQYPFTDPNTPACPRRFYRVRNP